jgi:hypothetical protein
MNPDLIRYMTAHVAIHCKEGASVMLWPARQIVDAFSLLAPPALDFATWASRINAMTAPEAEPDRSGELNASSVAMAECAKDLQRDGILTIQDA